MSKKRYTLYLSRELARKFDDTAKRKNGAKSALVEEALRVSLSPQQVPGVEDAMARRLNEFSKTLKTLERDLAIVTETLSLYVRYFLTITPPLPTDETEPAHLLGKERFQVFVAQVGRHLGTDRRLVTEVLETIATQHPDLFATAGFDTPLRNRPASQPRAAPPANGHAPDGEDESHG